MPKYSFIVPVYNGEKYIHQCLSSVLSQTYNDYEVIVADDGSTDGTPEICDEFADLKNVRVFHLKNGGVSRARNFAIDMARGKYICFVDSDDMVNNRLLSICDGQIGDSDILMFGYTRTENDFKIKNDVSRELSKRDKQLIIKRTVYPSKESADYAEINCNTVWGKIYKTDIIKKENLKFPDGIKIGEDKVFNFRFFNLCGKMRVSDDVLYYCRTHKNSVTLSYMPGCFGTNTAGLALLKSEIEKLDEGNLKEECMKLYMCTVVPMAKNCLILDYCNKKNKKPYIQRKREYMRDILSNESLKMKNECDSTLLGSYDKYLLKTLDFKFGKLNAVMKIRPLRLGLYFWYKMTGKLR